MIFVNEEGKLRPVKSLKFLHKKHVYKSFEEETVRARAAALDETELAWAVDELTKRGRIRGAVIM